jgi:hypothetical protein
MCQIVALRLQNSGTVSARMDHAHTFFAGVCRRFGARQAQGPLIMLRIGLMQTVGPSKNRGKIILSKELPVTYRSCGAI